MLFFKITLCVACIFTAIVLGHLTIGTNRSCLTGRTPIGWWIIGIGIIQLFILTIFTLWWEEWWIAHSLILKISAWVCIACLGLWGIIETMRRW